MKQDKNIEEFSKFILKKAGTEMPSNDFVNNVMDAINLENSKSTVTIYKPLISKQGWGLITVSLIVLIIFIITNTESLLMLPSIDFSFLNKFNSINVFENIKFSKIFTLSFVLFTIYVIFQLIIIKNYFSKRHII
ncbi:hypothetical protein [Lutibacter flavus]|uniref:Uncharacterized protein n=1 Tax=Lutibacter flavus TaxID=691689 RepID=A0A238VC46_9FLAO|nr:hypothetical protein [Lutibacter flavus]SNR31826.1 hypothetical protein SAMN04488111_0248 [Lutibacter flavus]